MIEVHVRQHHIGHRCQIDARRFKSRNKLACPRKAGVLFA
ncbi:hypothetical protein SZ54_4900 [Rhizobium sp. UR51a]|nr:hypothetical protein SZ54_4900 [Rhizobium sp. UR51a]